LWGIRLTVAGVHRSKPKPQRCRTKVPLCHRFKVEVSNDRAITNLKLLHRASPVYTPFDLATVISWLEPKTPCDDPLTHQVQRQTRGFSGDRREAVASGYPSYPSVTQGSPWTLLRPWPLGLGQPDIPKRTSGLRRVTAGQLWPAGTSEDAAQGHRGAVEPLRDSGGSTHSTIRR
jgi:hypothetical protein